MGDLIRGPWATPAAEEALAAAFFGDEPDDVGIAAVRVSVASDAARLIATLSTSPPSLWASPRPDFTPRPGLTAGPGAVEALASRVRDSGAPPPWAGLLGVPIRLDPELTPGIAQAVAAGEVHHYAVAGTPAAEEAAARLNRGAPPPR